jgi:hypothetical protein
MNAALATQTTDRRSFLKATAVLGLGLTSSTITSQAVDLTTFFTALRVACVNHLDVPILDDSAVRFLCDRLAALGWRVEHHGPTIKVSEPVDRDGWFTFVPGAT